MQTTTHHQLTGSYTCIYCYIRCAYFTKVIKKYLVNITFWIRDNKFVLLFICFGPALFYNIFLNMNLNFLTDCKTTSNCWTSRQLWANRWKDNFILGKEGKMARRHDGDTVERTPTLKPYRVCKKEKLDNQKRKMERIGRNPWTSSHKVGLIWFRRVWIQQGGFDLIS